MGKINICGKNINKIKRKSRGILEAESVDFYRNKGYDMRSINYRGECFLFSEFPGGTPEEIPPTLQKKWRNPL